MALPDVNDPPAILFKGRWIFSRSFYVAVNLVFPKFFVAKGEPEIFALVAVPETAIDFYDGSVLWQNNVRSSWQASVMQNKPETLSVNIWPYLLLRLRVFRADWGHDFGSYPTRKYVRHFVFSPFLPTLSLTALPSIPERRFRPCDMFRKGCRWKQSHRERTGVSQPPWRKSSGARPDV